VRKRERDKGRRKKEPVQGGEAEEVRTATSPSTTTNLHKTKKCEAVF
jgi:hypothetical protein